MKNSRDTTSGPPDPHSLEKPHEALESGPGWIRTSDTQNDDSGLGEPRGANESVGDGGSGLPEPVGLSRNGARSFATPDDDGHTCTVDPTHWCERCADPRAYVPFRDGVHEADSSPQAMQSLPVLTLEDRLLVALSARGNLRIGQLIVIATGVEQPFYVEDRDLVELVERFVFEGEDARVVDTRR